MTSTGKAPERIWAWGEPTPVYCSRVDPRDRRSATEYVRADLHDAAQSEIARLTAALERTEANREAVLSDLVEVTAERDQALSRAAAAAMEMRERAADEACYACGSQDIIRALPIDLDAQRRAWSD